MGKSDTITGKLQDSLHPDAHLVRACLKGDIASQRHLYDLYKRQMFRICLRYTSSREDAEDFLQEGFVRVFRDLRQFRHEGPLGAWIRKIMINTILQQLRKKRLLLVDTEMHQLENRYASEDDLAGNLDAEILTKYIQALPHGYRTVFNLYVIDGFTHQEIADMLGITTGTSKSQLSKARAMLRARIETLYPQE